MALVPLTDEDLRILAEIQECLQMDSPDILQRVIRGTLQHYKVHGTVTFLTERTHRCHGCRLLEMQQDIEEGTPNTAGNVIPFRSGDKPA